jgi:Fe-S cluster assembly scaffold protein SufB
LEEGVTINLELLRLVSERFSELGLPRELFENSSFNLLVDLNRVVLKYPAPGVRSEVHETPTGVLTRVYVEPGACLEEPVFLCFGATKSAEVQTTEGEIIVGEGADIKFVVYGAMAEGVKLLHRNRLKITVEEGARFEFLDFHYTGEETFVELDTKTNVRVRDGAYFKSLFKHVRGRAGKLRVSIEAEVGAGATAVLETKLMGKKDDTLYVEDLVHLNGEGARAVSKSRVVALDSAKAEFVGKMHGNAPHSRGHIDCSEIIRGEGVVLKAVPVVVVRDESAKVTHEAAIGSIDRKQLETLMARGLSEETAIDVIVQGLLR